MPAVLMQNLYINFHNYGPETAMRQMIDVIEGRNIFREGDIQEFKNIRAYISDYGEGFRIEFRAEAYMEPQSKFVILFTGGTKDDIDCSIEGVSMPVQYVERSSMFSTYIEIVFTVSRQSPTSPGFPFVVTFRSNKKNSANYRTNASNKFNYGEVYSKYLQRQDVYPI